MRNYKLVVIAFLLLSTIATAQPGFDDDVDDVGAPIPGIAIAIASAIGIGVYKLKNKK